MFFESSFCCASLNWMWITYTLVYFCERGWKKVKWSTLELHSKGRLQGCCNLFIQFKLIRWTGSWLNHIKWLHVIHRMTFIRMTFIRMTFNRVTFNIMPFNRMGPDGFVEQSSLSWVAQLSVINIMYQACNDLVTPKAGAKSELLSSGSLNKKAILTQSF
jgi:hypothetical protein